MIRWVRRINLIAFCLVASMAVVAKTSARIVINGVPDEIQQNIKLRLQAANATHESAAQAIQAATAPYGYFHPQVRVREECLRSTCTTIYTVNLGTPVKITRVDIQVTGPGANNSTIQTYLQQLPLHQGDIFTTPAYNQLKNNLFEIVNNQGYLKATLTDNRILIDKQRLTAVIILHLDTDERYYVGKLRFQGGDYDPHFLERFNIFAEDEPFSSEKLIHYQQQMNDSNYFKNIIVLPEVEHPQDHAIPIDVTVTPPKSRKYTLGVGYGTFTGPRVTGGVNFNRITDTGQSFNAQFKLSSVLSGLAARYTIPGRHPLTQQWLIGANVQSFHPKNGNSTSETLSLGYLNKVGNWQTTYTLNYLHERYAILNEPRRNSMLLSPNIRASYVKADNLINPTFGRSLNVSLQGAPQAVLSSTSFLQAQAQGKLFLTPFKSSHVVLRSQLGYTAVHDLTDLPLSMRFFAGGITSIRGYPDSSIGPGKYLGTASIEYQHHLTENWLGAAFYDVGTATNHFGTPLNTGIGVGVIYESIIGPIKVYVARAESKPQKPYQIEFSIGPEF